MSSYDIAGPEFPVVEDTDNPDAFVFLNAPKNLQMQKTVGRNEKGEMFEKDRVHYPGGKRYTFEVQKVDDLEDFADLMNEALDWTNTYAVRGAVLASAVNDGKIARAHDRGNPNRSLVDTPRRINMIDVDDTQVRFPSDWRDDEEGWWRMVIKDILPDAWHNAGHVIAYSGKADPLGGKPRAHIFSIFDRPLLSQQVKDWAGGLADDAVLTPSQPHLTARPIWFNEDGALIDDPFGDRRVLMLNGPEVITPTDAELALMAPREKLVPPGEYKPRVGRYGWTRLLKKFGEKQVGGEGLNGVILRLTMSYCSLTPPRERDREMLRSLVTREVEEAVSKRLLDRTAEAIEKEINAKFSDMYYRAEAKAAERWDDVEIQPPGVIEINDLQPARPKRAFAFPDYSDPPLAQIKQLLKRTSFFGG